MTPRPLLLACLLLWMTSPIGAHAQNFGASQLYTTHSEYAWLTENNPILIDELALYETSIPKDRADSDIYALFIAMQLDGSGEQEERRLKKPSLPGAPSFSNLFTFNDRLWGLFQTWDKETGRVDVYIQQYDLELITVNTPMKVGSIQLEPSSYKGQILWIEPHISPDGSKLLFYFDGVETGKIKLAMCWVWDEEMNPLWDGIYRLPVQALGASTEARLFDNGSVSVSVMAVELDEKNTRERSDGRVEAKVNSNYEKKTTLSLYVLHNEVFAKIDGETLGGRIRAGGLQYGPSGWVFMALLESGKGNNTTTERVVGHLGPDGASIQKRTPIAMDEGRVMFDPLGYFYTTHATKRGPLTVAKFDQEGTELWSHSAPLGRDVSFRIINGMVVTSLKATKGSLERLQEDKAVGIEEEHFLGCIPLFVVWHNGKRTATSVMPIDTPRKEAHSISVPLYSITERGLWFRKPSAGSDHIGFIPITW